MPSVNHSYSERELVDALSAAGLQPADTVFMPSALFALGEMADTTLNDIPEKIYNAVMQVIGPEGTLLVPAAFEDYARFGTPYDTRLSRVDPGQGAFSQYIVDRAESWRTYCPLTAVAGVGPLANDICHSWTASSFGVDSAWDKIYQYDAKFVFLGIPPGQALPFVYYVQQRFGVPHLYNKLFTTPIYENGKAIDLPVTCLVRYLDSRFRIIESTSKFEAHLNGKNLIHQGSLGRGSIFAISSAREIFDEAVKMLQRDIYYFLQSPPTFVDGEVPMDSVTGPMMTDENRFGSA